MADNKDGQTGKPDWSQMDRIQMIALENFELDPLNPRNGISRSALEEMKEDMEKNGVREPIKVRRSKNAGKVVIVSGHRRAMAAKLAGLKLLPCILTELGKDKASRLEELYMHNRFRQDLNPIESANTISELMKLNRWSQAVCSRELKLDQSYISQHLRLLELPEDVRKHVSSGAIPVATAYAIAQRPKGEQASLASNILSGRLTGREIKEFTTGSKRSSGSRSASAVTDHRIEVSRGKVAVRIICLEDRLTPKQLRAALEEALTKVIVS